MKTISTNSERNLRKAKKEVEILQTIDHPTLIRSMESFSDGGSIHIVSEYYSGQALIDLINKEQKITEQRALRLMYYILSGLNYLHKHRIVHRDIKPENLIFESSDKDSILKIIDFGTAKFMHKKKCDKKKGTTFYMSPQVIDGAYTEKCDIWSAGIIFCILLTGVHPFYCDSEQDMMEKIRHQTIMFKGSAWDSVSPQTKKIISSMLEKKEKNRSSAYDLLQNKSFNMSFVMQASDIQSIFLKSSSFKLKSEPHRLLINIGIIKVLESINLGKIFLYLDQDSDGRINLKDLSPEYPKDSYLTFSDFLIRNTPWDHLLTPSILEQIFDHLDNDNDNLISPQDIIRYFKSESSSQSSGKPTEMITFEDFSSSLNH
jgi:calcium-dependent protein kinase